MENKKKIIMVVLSVLVCIMAVGYAVLAQQLNINGTASIDSTWKVEITNIQEQEVVGKATSKVTPSYTSTTANFSVGLTQPGDSITYDVEISNLGTLDAKVDSININVAENDAIKYTTTGIANGDQLAAGEKAILTIKVEYDSSVTSQPSITTSDITITVNYVQDLGEESSETSYDYVIGDTITFAGSNWYVIKNSTADEDYVTLLKEKVLTSSELGEYAANYTTTCTAVDVTEGNYGCTTEGETVTRARDTMLYYWSDTCHLSGYRGYTNYDDSGCAGHNDYEGSEVKEFLEGTYINTLGSDNLKEVDGYKIRLITTEELNANLGWVNLNTTAQTDNENANVPTWVYQNFGYTDGNNGTWGYWTMTPNPEASFYVWRVNDAGYLHSYRVFDVRGGVRPVINLLKSSIQ